MNKVKYLVVVLLISCICNACGNNEANSKDVKESREAIQTSVPENAFEIITDLFVEVSLEEEMPVISIYDYSDDTAAALLTYARVITCASDYIENCVLFIYTAEEVVETSLQEQNMAKEPEDAMLPEKYHTFMQDKNIGEEGTYDIFQFLDNETVTLISENVQTYISDVLEEHYGESLVEENSEAESSETEAESSENEIAKEIIKSEEYEAEQVEITMTLSEDSEKEYHLSVWISSEVEWKLAYSYIMYDRLLAIEGIEGFNPVLIASGGDVMLSSLGLSMEGTKIIDPSEWCTNQLVSGGYDAEGAAALADELKNALLDFLELTE